MTGPGALPRSKEERAVELLRMRAYGGSRGASETADERQVRLQRLRTKPLERLAAEPTDDCQARLQRLRTGVRSLTRMALPQARPTMLCIH